METAPKKPGGNFILLTVEEFEKWLSGNLPKRRITSIQNHHTFKPAYADFTGRNHFRLLRGMEDYHIQTNKWNGIGQHITTFPDGKLAIGRDLEKTPACIYGANTGAICMEHVGNFDLGKDFMYETHRQAIIEVNAILCNQLKLIPTSKSIVYHHWFNLQSGKREAAAEKSLVTPHTKTCPGTGFFGGNTVKAMESYLLPAVVEAMAKINGKALNELVSSAAESIISARKEKEMIVTASSLFVRNLPGMNGKVVAVLKMGEKVKVFDTNGSWSLINKEKRYWVHGKWLKEIV